MSTAASPSAGQEPAHSSSGDEAENFIAENTFQTTKTMQQNTDLVSRVEYYGSSVSYCGYCKRDVSDSDGRRSHDMKAFQLRAKDYQMMLDRGWRRSGNYCYRLINKKTCCPNYPISCDAAEFKLSRSQRKCIEKVNKFLIYGTSKQQTNGLTIETDSTHRSINQSNRQSHMTFEQLRQSTKLRDKRFAKSCERKCKLYGLNIEEAMKQIKNKWTKQRYQPATLENHLFPRIGNVTSSDSETQNLKPKHQLKISLCQVNSSESESLRLEEHEILMKYQQKIHSEDKTEWTMFRYCGFLVNSPIILEPLQNFDHVSDCDNDSLSVDCCPKNADQLLVRPPQLPTHLGTYHVNYHLDGKLIAVGVLDVLPKCITTVYFFYDPDYGHLNLGIYSALVEISMVRQLGKHFVPNHNSMENKLRHYYLGFYVHECKKMHYKTRFRPSYLLCSETNTYVPTEICLSKLVDKKYDRFSEPDVEDEDSLGDTSSVSVFIPYIVNMNVSAPVTNSSTLKKQKPMMDYIQWIKRNLGDDHVDFVIENFLCTYLILAGKRLSTSLCLQVNTLHRVLLERHRRLTANARQEQQTEHHS